MCLEVVGLGPIALRPITGAAFGICDVCSSVKDSGSGVAFAHAEPSQLCLASCHHLLDFNPRRLESSSTFAVVSSQFCTANNDLSHCFQHVRKRSCHRHHDFRIQILYYVLPFTTYLIAPANMISLSSNIRFERLSTKIAPTMPGIIEHIATLDETPAKKQHITKTKEIANTVPKSIVLPTPSTPTRYGSLAPISTAH